MFERFTEKAIKVIMLAQEEARRLGHNFVGTEQILLGLIGEGTGVAAKVLRSMGVNLKDARIEVEKIIGRGSGFVAVEIPFTPRAKRVLELSLEEARQLGHNYIGTEHLLLGLIREGEGVAARVLENLGVDLSKVRTQVIRMLGETAEVNAGSPSGRTKTPTLDEFGSNLTQMAADGKLDPVVGRAKEIERVIQILGRRTKNNPASIAPSAAPAPMSVCTSSITKITFPAERISSMIFLRRSSNSPRYLVPATNNPISRVTTRFSSRISGISLLAIREANPSAIAVLPTPGSPINTGLFFVRRPNI